MSAPARVVDRDRAAVPRLRVTPPRRDAPAHPAPARVSPGPGASPRRRAAPAIRARRRRQRITFVVFSSAVVSLAVTGVVALNALLAQGEFRIQALEHRIDGLSEQYRVRTEEAARLSAPGRIAAWARKHGMRLPDEIHILHVPGPDRAAPAGEPALSGLALKPIVEGP